MLHQGFGGACFMFCYWEIETSTKYKYNDVRVNLLALLAANVWKDSLPNILKSRVMDPIGASETWKWHGYTNSWIDINNKKIQSVSGGGHWGGGMFINAMDQARFGYLFLSSSSFSILVPEAKIFASA